MDKTGKHTDSASNRGTCNVFSYYIGGLFSVIPTILFNQPAARYIAIASSFTGLLTVGYIKGHIVDHKPLRSAIELLLIGGMATLIGVAVGMLLKV